MLVGLRIKRWSCSFERFSHSFVWLMIPAIELSLGWCWLCMKIYMWKSSISSRVKSDSSVNRIIKIRDVDCGRVDELLALFADGTGKIQLYELSSRLKLCDRWNSFANLRVLKSGISSRHCRIISTWFKGTTSCPSFPIDIYFIFNRNKSTKIFSIARTRFQWKYEIM